MTKPVDAPAVFVPQGAIAFGASGDASVGVDRNNALPVESGSEGMASTAIAAGTALSAAVDLDRQRLHRIILPATWTTAELTFQSSFDGSSWNDLFDASGEIVLAATLAVPGRAIVVDPSVFYGIRYLKLRSGTNATPVNQAAARTLTLATVAR